MYEKESLSLLYFNTEKKLQKKHVENLSVEVAEQYSFPSIYAIFGNRVERGDFFSALFELSVIRFGFSSKVLQPSEVIINSIPDFLNSRITREIGAQVKTGGIASNEPC